MHSRIPSTFTALLFLLLATGGAESKTIPHTTFRFAAPSEGGELLGSHDEFVNSLSPSDRACRLKSTKPVSKEDFVSRASRSAVKWKEGEVERFEGFLGPLSDRLSRLRWKLPETILLIKTSGMEEAGAAVAYTRKNAIVFTEPLLKGGDDQLKRIFIHEVFHILSRTNPDLRDDLYEMIGFFHCGQVELSKDLSARKISNPDAPSINYAITVFYGGALVKAVPATFSRSTRCDDEGSEIAFPYGSFKLLVIEEGPDGCRPQLTDGRPRLLDVGEVTGFFEKVGRNTTYVSHPEEILADNFEILLNGKKDVPTPRIISNLRSKLFGPLADPGG